MKPIQLFGTGVKSYSPAVTAQRRLNCFYDIREDGDSSKMICRGTPGTLLWITLPVKPIRGWRVVNGYMYVVAGASLFKVGTDGTYTNLGTITSGKTNYVGMDDNGIELFIVDGSSGFVVNLALGSITQVTDANFPAGATTAAFINGRMLVEKPNSRQFYVGQSYNSGSFTPAIFATKENYSDQLVAVNVLNGIVILWGAGSIEFWQDVGGSSVPYKRIDQTTATVGLAAKMSRAFLSNTMFFLGVNPVHGGLQVYKLNGYVPQRVSNSDIENFIKGLTSFSDAVALTYMIDGHPMYQLTFPTDNRTIVYDDLTQAWHEAQTGVALTGRHFGNLSIAFNGLNFCSDSSTGNIYQFADTAYTDNGTPIKRQLVTRHINKGGNVFGIDELRLAMETGVGLQSGQGSAPLLVVEASKDRGNTWLPERRVSIGAVGQYVARVILRRFGQARDFVWRITMTDPVKFVITEASVTDRGREGQIG